MPWQPRRVLLAGVFVLAALAPAAAQTPTRDRPFPVIREARRWGPFLVDPSFVIDNIGYDDNVYFAPTNVDDADRPRESDFVVRMGPDIRAQLQFGPRVALTFRDRASGEVFLSHSNLNHLDNTLEGQFDVLLGPLLLTAKGRLLTAEDRPYSELVDRTKREEQGASIGARLFLTPRVDLGGSVGTVDTTYHDPNRFYTIFAPDPDGDGTVAVTTTIDQALDRSRTETQADIGWRPRGRVRLFLAYKEREVDFETNVEGVSRDSREEQQMAGLEFATDAYLSGRLIYGRSELNAVDSAGLYRPFDGPVSDTELTYRPTGATRIRARYLRDIGFSTYLGNLYFEDTQRRLEMDVYTAGRWGFQVGASRQNTDYPEPGSYVEGPGNTAVIDPDAFREDEITDYYGGLIFSLRGGLQLGLRYGVRDRDSTDPFAVERQHYITTTGSYSF
ncbi:MAG: outer membrane beta-barrel protein [Acidobacteria bacterium]|nr:outer membrane beta-barrel protein [Acidobacteriota bacterium]